MKIKNILLHNVGPYKEPSSFDFAENREKNIILIGGKNGAGKTTLFKAIQFCLYGSRALGYEVNNQNYFKEIKKIVNINNVLTSNSCAEVSVTISLENSTDFDDYSVTRKWDLKNDKIVEDLSVIHGGVELSDEELADFENMMLQLIPPDLFDFYFFNGEKIFEMLFDEESKNNFKSSFVKIVGLDTIDILIENFEKHAIEKSVNKKLTNDYTKALEKYKKIKEEKNAIEGQIREVEEAIKGFEDNLVQAKKKYSKNKVLTITERNRIETELKGLDDTRERCRKFLKDAGNNYIPFLLLRPELEKLFNTIKSSKSSISSADLKVALLTNGTREYLESKFDDVTGFVDELLLILSKDSGNSCLQLTNNERSYLIDQISSILSEDKKDEVINAENEYISTLSKGKELRAILEANSGERNEEYQSLESELNSKIIAAQNDRAGLFKKLTPVLDKYAVAHSEYLEVKAIYESELKKESVSSISFNASSSFKKLKDKLMDEKITILKDYFVKNFELLINKDDLISGIAVEEDLTVYPYKTIRITNAEAKNMIKNSNVNLLIEQYGNDGFNAIKSIGNKEFVEVNKKILGTMSAGESQIYVIALYMSMIQLSRVNIPLIIDTPFGRVDEIHRTNLVDNFLKKITNETIILSTDEEIIGPLYNRISDAVACEYTITNFSQKGTHVSSGYFKEGK